MSSPFEPIFTRLRAILQTHAKSFIVRQDVEARYGIDAPVGPATLRAWGGKAKSSTIPVAWVEVGRAYVSFHLMGVNGNPKLLEGCSAGLRARMQGKACFNFKSIDESLFKELEQLTAKSLQGMRKAGFILEQRP